MITEGTRIVGYFALAAGAVAWDEAPSRVRRGLARHPVPVVVLARLAVDRSAQGTGLGAYLLRAALARVAVAADVIGVRAVLVHAKDEQVASFYRRFGFEPSPIDARQFFILVKDIRRALGQSPPEQAGERQPVIVDPLLQGL